MPRDHRPRSARFSRQRYFRTSQGELTHMSSPNGRDTYFWNTEGGRTGKQLAASRPRDFTFEYQEGNKLLVLPKERILYCAGRTLGGYITAVTAVDKAEPESAEVYTGSSTGILRRKKTFQPTVIGSRLEVRVGLNTTLLCGKDGMHLAGEPLRMLDPTSLKLEIDNRKGMARLTRAWPKSAQAESPRGGLVQ